MRIIHSFFRPKTHAVNKFCLLSFGKILFDRKISVAACRRTAAFFRKQKLLSAEKSLRQKICSAQFPSTVGATYL
jgi:hypothetical protein